MSIKRYRDALRDEAERHHTTAQETGDPAEYDKAAESYEKIGDFDEADRCRDAARRLRAVSDETA